MSEHVKVAIIGSGPSGWSAATYLARAQLAPIVFSGEKPGGQLMMTTEVENYAGFDKGIMGPQLMQQMREQAIRFGAVVKDQLVSSIDVSVRPFSLVLQSGEPLTADAVLIATGAETIWLQVPGEEKLIGRGVSSCAVCDAAFFKSKRTMVIGGGDSAMEDALALTKFADSVTMVHRRDSFRASKIMSKRVLAHEKVKVEWNAVVTEVLGEQKVTGVVLQSVDADGKRIPGTERTIELDGVFVAIGHKPVTGFLNNQLLLDEKGYLVTRLVLNQASQDLAQQAMKNGILQYPTMTSVEGVFGAGDVVDFRYRQAITAAGYGAMASLDIERWLEAQANV